MCFLFIEKTCFLGGFVLHMAAWMRARNMTTQSEMELYAINVCHLHGSISQLLEHASIHHMMLVPAAMYK